MEGLGLRMFPIRKNMSEMRNLWPESVLFGKVVYPPGGTLGPRIQPTIELVIVHTGEMNIWVDGERCHAEGSTVTILFPGHEERFQFATTCETWHSYLHIALPDLPAGLNARLRRLPRTLPLSSQMAGLLESGLTLRNSPLSTSGEILKAIGTQMLWLYVGEGEGQVGGRLGNGLHPAVERARNYIRIHLSESLNLEDIAAYAAVSPSHLIRLFQAELGATPMAYVWEQRLQTGIELLEQTGLPVNLVAERCGFQTSDHFSRRVRARTGYSPLEVRRRAWGR
jgi:AraC family transcriptional regulator of arabinose operon